MIEGGYILQPRSWDKSRAAHLPPATRELWFYLLRNVSHADSDKGKRGERFFNLEEIQEALSWKVGYRVMKYSKPQLTKALRRLREELMIATPKATHGIHVTIINFDAYQNPKNYEGNGEGFAKETRRKREGNANKNVKNVRMKEEDNTPLPPEGGALPSKKKIINQLAWELLNPGFSDDFMTRVWPAFVRNKKGKYKNLETQSIALKQLFEKSGYVEATAVQALRETLANGYQGFTWYFDKTNKMNGYGDTTKRDANGLSKLDYFELSRQVTDSIRRGEVGTDGISRPAAGDEGKDLHGGTVPHLLPGPAPGQG